MSIKATKQLAMLSALVLALLAVTVLLPGCKDTEAAKTNGNGDSHAKAAQPTTCPFSVPSESCCAEGNGSNSCGVDCDKACCEAKKAAGTCPKENADAACPKQAGTCPKAADAPNPTSPSIAPCPSTQKPSCCPSTNPEFSIPPAGGCCPGGRFPALLAEADPHR